MSRFVERVQRLALRGGGLPLVWIVLTVMVLIPVWHQRLLPQLDAPNHLALVRAWHSYHDASYRIAEYYTLRIRPVPYILFYLVCHLLMFVVSIETANKLFLSLYLILFPLSVVSLARALKRSPWLALGAFPLAFNQNWIYGFNSYLLGTCFMFFALARLIRYLDEGRRRDLVLLGASTLLAYFAHVMPWFCLGIGVIPILWLERQRWRRVLYASSVMLPSLALMVVAYARERGDRTYMKHGEGFAAIWRDFPQSVAEFPKRVLEIFPGKLDAAVLIILAATVLALLATRRRPDGEENSHCDPPRPSGGGPAERRLRWLVLVLALAYVSMPYQISKPLYWWFIAPRVPSMIAPLLLLWPAGSIEGRRRLLLIPMIAGAIALPIKLASLYRDFSNRNAPFMRLITEIPRGASTLVVVRGMMRGTGSEEKSGDPATSAPAYWHFSSWPMALNGGYSPYLFDQGIPVQPKVTLRAPAWSAPDTFDIRQAPDYEYYIVRLPPESLDREPALHQIDQLGEWALYKRIHALTDEP